MSGSARREWAAAGIFCLVAAALLLLSCSQSSPLFPLNTWDDANCLLTVGRVMKHGGVLYRDIYEQKGPTLYLMHMMAAMISETSFFGVYIMETVSLAAALLIAYGMIRWGAGVAVSLGMCALWGALVLVSRAFAQGDSAEEMCLPYLMGALALASAEYGAGRGPMRTKNLFVCGLLAGVVATIKYTILGLFVGLCIAEGIIALRAGGMRRALRSAGAFLCGMVLPVVPWIVYFAANGALSDAYTAYIHNNIFLYQGGGEDGLLLTLARAVRDNASWSVFAAAGVALTVFDQKKHPQLRGAMLSMALCTLAVVFLLGRTWPYCPLVLSVFAVPCMAAASGWLGRRSETAAGIAAAALAVLLAWGQSPNAYLRGVPKEELAQARLAAHVEDGATVLQYTHLDDGLYLLTGALPQEKYFVRLNVAYDEMRAELDRYVAQGMPDYVLCSWRELPAEFDGYELVAYDEGYDDSGRIGKGFYLYRRK